MKGAGNGIGDPSSHRRSGVVSGWSGGGFRRRPLVGLTLTHMAGLILGIRWVPAEAWGVAAGLSLVFAAVTIRRPIATVALFFSFCGLGGFHAALHRPGASACHIERLMEAPRESLQIAGRILDDPSHRAPSSDARERLVFTLRAERLYRIWPSWQRSRGTVRVFVHGSWEDRERPVYGDRVLLEGVLRCGPPHRMHLNTGDVRRLSSGHGSALVAMAYRWRAASLARIARFRDAFPGETAVLQAMLLGHRADLPEEVRSTFQVTGAMHILAISGLHVGIVLAFLLGMLRFSGLSRRYWVLALAPVLLAYMTAAGLPRSAIRATLMALAYWSAPLFRRRPDALSSVALAALIILWFDPLALHDPGFIFSFTIVTGLLTLIPVSLRRWEASPPNPDDWVPGGPGRRARFLRAVRRRGVDLVVVSGIAWAVSLPLMARYSHVFSPVGLPANLLVVPTAFAAVWSGGLALLLDASFPWAASGAFAVAHAVAGFLIRMLHGLASVPGGHFFVRAPPVALVLVWYGALGLFFRGGVAGRRLVFKGMAVAVLGVLVAQVVPGALRIEVPGASIGCGPLIRGPDRQKILFDPGPSFQSERVLRYLRARGVNRIETLVLTRADARHMGATLDLARPLRVREVWVPDYPARSRVFRETVEKLNEMGISVRPLAEGERLETGPLHWEALHPARDRAGNRADQNDLILRLIYGDRTILFSGSAGAETAVQTVGLLDGPYADIPVWGLVRHASAREETEAWLDAVHPAFLIDAREVHDDRETPREWMGEGRGIYPAQGFGRTDVILHRSGRSHIRSVPDR